jgi:membrane-bound lytic murein transglycosylase A
LSRATALFFADDPYAVFFLHIQGSGRILLEDGTIKRVAYAGQNGWPYTAVGRVLVQEGTLPKEGLSMQVIRKWMKANPVRAKQVMERDLSYVFFKEAPLGDPSLGSPGAQGVPLTPERSLAVDRHIHPLGAPFFLVAQAPDPDPARPDRPLARLVIAQDTGGAIRGPLRGDVFFGYGGGAESVAGRMKSEGKLYVLLPRALAQRMAGARS